MTQAVRHDLNSRLTRWKKTGLKRVSYCYSKSQGRPWRETAFRVSWWLARKHYAPIPPASII